MIAEFVSRWEERKSELRTRLKEKHPDSYKELVQEVIRTIGAEDEYGVPSYERVHMIDDGDYQGTLLFVIGAGGYQPSEYWYCKVGYGSCSGCDTLQSIRNYEDDKPTKEQVDQYMTLALHIVQGLKEMGD